MKTSNVALSIVVIFMFARIGLGQNRPRFDIDTKPEMSASARALMGTNGVRNSMLLGEAVKRLKSSALKLLQSERVADELKLNNDQIQEVASLASELLTSTEIFQQIGIASFAEFGSLALPEAEVASRKYKAIVMEFNRDLDVKIEKILRPRQFDRLRQIYLQTLIMSPNRKMLQFNPLELGMSFDKSQAADIISLMRNVDSEIREAVTVMKYKGYTASMDEVLGDSKSRQLIGKPFVVDIPEEHAKPKATRRRNTDD